MTTGTYGLPNANASRTMHTDFRQRDIKKDILTVPSTENQSENGRYHVGRLPRMRDVEPILGRMSSDAFSLHELSVTPTVVPGEIGICENERCSVRVWS